MLDETPAPTRAPVVVPVQVHVSAAAIEDGGDDDDLPPSNDAFVRYLESDRGHEIVGQLLGMYEQLKSSGARHAAGERIAQYVMLALVIGAATWLAIVDKFSGPIGLLFGSLLGYIFGRRSHDQ